MNCMNSAVVKKLARIISLESLLAMADKKDKLTSKLYMKKLEVIFEDDMNILHRCIYCSELFTLPQTKWSQCSKAKRLFVTNDGKRHQQHIGDKNWDINKFVMFLRQKHISWNKIFWKMFARINNFKCLDCGKYYAGSHIN